MSRKVFFSFHFNRDAWRAGQVRNSDMLADEDEYGVIDSVSWEKIEKQGRDAIKRWIDDQLKHTSVTVVLVGAQTSDREWVEYEIRKSWERGNALVGVRIHNVKDQHQKTDIPGANPLDEIQLVNAEPLSSIFNTYDWVADNGRENLGDWVEEAFQIRENYEGDLKLAAESIAVVAPTAIKSPAQPWSSSD